MTNDEVDPARVNAVLEGALSYDDLNKAEAQRVRRSWEERAVELRLNLNLEREFTAVGRSWSETAQDGSVVVRPAASLSLVDIVGTCWSADRAAKALDISLSGLKELGDDNGVLCLQTSDDATIYPTSQFESSNGAVWVKPAVARLLEGFACQDRWAVAVIMETPSPELDELAPLEAARRGWNHDELYAFACRVSREWAQ